MGAALTTMMRRVRSPSSPRPWARVPAVATRLPSRCCAEAGEHCVGSFDASLSVAGSGPPGSAVTTRTCSGNPPGSFWGLRTTTVTSWPAQRPARRLPADATRSPAKIVSFIWPSIGLVGVCSAPEGGGVVGGPSGEGECGRPSTCSRCLRTVPVAWRSGQGAEQPVGISSGRPWVIMAWRTCWEEISGTDSSVPIASPMRRTLSRWSVTAGG